MPATETDFVLMLEAIDVSSGQFRLKEPAGQPLPVLRLSIRAKRHQQGQPAAATEALPPIYLEESMAAALPSALLAALETHLPSAAKAAREQLASLLQDGNKLGTMN